MSHFDAFEKSDIFRGMEEKETLQEQELMEETKGMEQEVLKALAEMDDISEGLLEKSADLIHDTKEDYRLGFGRQFPEKESTLHGKVREALERNLPAYAEGKMPISFGKSVELSRAEHELKTAKNDVQRKVAEKHLREAHAKEVAKKLQQKAEEELKKKNK